MGLHCFSVFNWLFGCGGAWNVLVVKFFKLCGYYFSCLFHTFTDVEFPFSLRVYCYVCLVSNFEAGFFTAVFVGGGF